MVKAGCMAKLLYCYKLLLYFPITKNGFDYPSDFWHPECVFAHIKHYRSIKKLKGGQYPFTRLHINCIPKLK